MAVFNPLDTAGPLLSIANLHAGYGDTEVLRGVSFDVAPQSFVGILGPNGSGKTTLLKTITRILAMKSGSIVFSGADLAGVATHELTRLGISIVPEGKQLWGDLTIGEHLQTAGENAGRDRATQERQVALIFSLFPLLKDRYRSRVNTLSGGQQQMVAVGRALMSAPRLLLLDEPSVGLAPKVTLSMFEAITELRKADMAVILVEQNIAAALGVVDHVHLLRDGSILKSGTADEVRQMDFREIFLH